MNNTLKNKILLPFLLILTIIAGIALILTNNIYQINVDREGEKLAGTVSDFLDRFIAETQSDHLKTTQFIASLPKVVNAFESYLQDSIDRQELMNILKVTFETYEREYMSITNLNHEFIFYLPNAEIVYQSVQSRMKEDDAYSLMAVNQISKNRNPLSGFDFRDGQLFINTIVPVYSETYKRLIGILEMKVPATGFIRSSRVGYQNKHAVLIHKNVYTPPETETSVILSETADSIRRFGDYFYMLKSSSIHSLPDRFGQLLETSLNASEPPFYFTHNNDLYSVKYLNDIQNNVLGLFIIKTPEKAYYSGYTMQLIISVISIIVLFTGSILIAIYTGKRLQKRLSGLDKRLDDLKNGIIPDISEDNYNDEIGHLEYLLNSLITNLKEKSIFAHEISKRNFRHEFTSYSNKDELGNALIELKNSLRSASEEEAKRRIEDEKIQWSTQGKSIINEVLRHDYGSLAEFSFAVIKSIVKYLDANQGGLYILAENKNKEKYLELKGAYAYNKRKYIDKTIPLGEGLLGLSAQEGYSIYRSDIPKNYVQITSGLGFATPTNLLIVPLKVDNEILGAFEVASFKKIEKYKIEFTEIIAENIASSISNVKISTKTKELLEQSQKQAKTLEEHEQEMKQKISEIEKLKEEALKKEEEASVRVQSIDQSFLHAEFDIEGFLIYANNRFLEELKFLFREIEGRQVYQFLEESDRERFEGIWKRLSKGADYYSNELRLNGREDKIWILSTFSAIKNKSGRVDKIMLIGKNINEHKLLTINTEQELKALNNSILKAEYKPDGTLINVNAIYIDIFGYSKLEFKNQNVFSQIESKKETVFRSLWDKALSGEQFSYLHQLTTKAGKQKIIYGIYKAVYDYDGFVDKIIFAGLDISRYYLKTDVQK